MRAIIAIRFLVAASALVLAVASPVSASCQKKNQQIDSLIARLVDFANSNDTSQMVRDEDVIRVDVAAIDNEDCLNATAEMERLSDLAKTLNVDFVDNESDEFLLTTSIRQKEHYSVTEDTPDCRCYARREAVDEIFSDVQDMLSTYNDVSVTFREERALYAWFKVLNGYLYEIIGIRLPAYVVHGNPITVAFNADQITTTFENADAILKKHCKLSIRETAKFPQDCKYHESLGPSPTATPTP